MIYSIKYITKVALDPVLTTRLPSNLVIPMSALSPSLIGFFNDHVQAAEPSCGIPFQSTRFPNPRYWRCAAKKAAILASGRPVPGLSP
ncbi:hypothetical protein AG1IA_03532 [Rhizoctonia solani AG-1 IA]|uniref:Uncharacterized protein n=1 Tax=Thanatephorus cucumeris (strain AG1-IA) TaxID=983506 RepID=L8X095_THACA|nr:hypothetical protein AG1IA_03532 [Rhizoctonia solani AG-1 IA]